MIKLEHIFKYYNKNRRNEVVVCNDLCLEFPEKGLVTILGTSGSGKTTLLNVISGMDNFDSGTLTFNGITIEKYSHKKWDYIRKEKIGYVYQDYNLLKELSVAENIEPVIRMQGIKNESVIRESIKYLLKSVGLENYEDRLAKQLSGGQQQRVVFARALANNPKVMLADEPTGNLDGKTTIELMNVIKEISKSRLVILVTHERELCEYYADRIIEIESGTIKKDYINDKQKKLKYLQEHIINLRDFKKTNLTKDQLNVSRYSNEVNPEPLDIDLIERNQTLYVKTNSKSVKRIKYLDDNSEIVILNSTKEEQFQNKDFNLEHLYPKDLVKKKANAFSWKEIFKYALNKLKKLSNANKMLYLAMLLLGVIISISVGLLGEIYYLEESYNELHSNYITVELDRSMYNDYMEVENVDGVEQLMLVSEPFEFNIKTPTYYEITGSVKVTAQPIDIKFFDEETLIYGKQAEDYEIIIDKSVANQLIQDYRKIGVLSYEDVLNCQFKIQTSGLDNSVSIDTGLYFKISGIADTNSRSVWMKENLIYSFVTPTLLDYEILGEKFQVVSGTLPSYPSYAMLNDQFHSILLGNIPNNIGLTTGQYNISGVYRYEVDDIAYDFSKVLISKMEYMKPKYFQHSNYSFQDFELLVYANDVENTLNNLEEAGYTVSANIYEPELAQQIKLEENQTFYILAIAGIVISALCILFIMRSNLVSRIYEVSVYRSVGVSRREIRRIFLVEVLLATTISSVLGFLIMVVLINQAQSNLLASSIARFNFLTIIIVVFGIYGINTLFGLMPINLLLQKTPANIFKQSDL
ncbi:MAG: ABC transporter ATP-binding protein/permease [Candidatus Izimaplasma sp.]|nr:ABC transporter ATP-binding protein/permease [Candidatus Izimaplasma bacterium]